MAPPCRRDTRTYRAWFELHFELTGFRCQERVYAIYRLFFGCPAMKKGALPPPGHLARQKNGEKMDRKGKGLLSPDKFQGHFYVRRISSGLPGVYLMCCLFFPFERIAVDLARNFLPREIQPRDLNQ